MSRLVWDQLGDRVFETGVSNGVLYLDDRSGVAWNGLTGIDESFSDANPEPQYFDGERFIQLQEQSSYTGTLTAITYPEEFLVFDGSDLLNNGMIIDNQASKYFHLSYKTLAGDDVSGIDAGYKIHILYNLTATPDATMYQTVGASVEPVEFSWELSSKPEVVPNYHPTAHAIIDSRYLPEDLMTDLEETLYGTPSTDPYLPSLSDLTTHISGWGLIIVIDHGDGTWSAIGPDEFFSMINPTTFQITDINGSYLDANTYQVSSSIPD